MKISKIFHYLYLVVMCIPIVAVLFNFIRFGLSGSITLTSFEDLIALVSFPSFGGLSEIVNNVFTYLIVDLFGFSGLVSSTLVGLLTYWCCVSLIWLVFDVLMYLPLLVHRWLDKGVLE